MTPAQFDRLLRLFVAWTRQEFGYELYGYQLRIARACLSSLFVEPRDVYIKIARQSGKCLAQGTPILMHDGSIKAVEEIEVGDLLMGDDSTPRRVLSLARGRERMWRVQPNSKGHEPYTVNESHILTVACRRTGKIIDRPLRSIKSLKQIDSCVLGVKVPVQFQARPPPVDPYWFGLWLGDGRSADVGITNADPEVVNFLWNYAGSLGMVLSIYPEKNASDTYAITNGYGNNVRAGRRINPLRQALQDMGVHKNKHIPDIFRVNSEDVRLKMLAGIIDSDGHRSPAPGKEHVCELVFRSKRLASDIQWLARSLGFRASLIRKVVKGEDYWRVMLYGELWRVPTLITRKQYPVGTLRENPRTYGFTLVDEGIGDYYGFEIDGNKRFLLGDCTVTHNTETVTLLVRFLIVFYRKLAGEEIQAGIASPKGEIAKTDIDRIKKSLLSMRANWQVEDRENNAETIRAYHAEDLLAEIFKFSLGPNSTNESKTLKILIVEEAHKCNDKKRADELDPMLTATDGVTWMIGVGCTRKCDFKNGCDGKEPDSVAIVVDAEEVIRDRRAMFEKTGDPKHLKYERTFRRILKKKGRNNPQVKLNYYLIDDVEQGNFVSEEKLKSCARPAGAVIPTEKLYFGIDWGRKKDHTWVVLTNAMCDIVDMLKVPHMKYESQIEEIVAWLTNRCYYQRIYSVRGDSTGQGDMPMEFLGDHTRLPVEEESHVKFTMSSKNVMYTGFEEAINRDPTDERRFSYPSDHELTPEFEEQMLGLLRETIGDGGYLSVHHDEDDDEAHDDAPDATALALLAASVGEMGEILVG